MTKRPDLPIEQTATIIADSFNFDRINRLLNSVERFNTQIRDEHIRETANDLLDSIRLEIKHYQDREQTRNEIINDLLAANKSL